MFKNAVLNLCIAGLLSGTITNVYAEESHGKIQVNINDPKFKAAQPWDTATMTASSAQ